MLQASIVQNSVQRTENKSNQQPPCAFSNFVEHFNSLLHWLVRNCTVLFYSLCFYSIDWAFRGWRSRCGSSYSCHYLETWKNILTKWYLFKEVIAFTHKFSYKCAELHEEYEQHIIECILVSRKKYSSIQKYLSRNSKLFVKFGVRFKCALAHIRKQ